MNAKQPIVWVLAAGLLGCAGFMMKLMYDMTLHMGQMTTQVERMSGSVELMTGHVGQMAGQLERMNGNVAVLTGDVGEMNTQVTGLAGDIGEMKQHVATMALHMSRMGQTIKQGSETFQRWNPMEMLRSGQQDGQQR